MNAILNQNKQIAETILNQLGGSRFIAMTGAYDLCVDKNCLIFKFKGSRKANACRITLDLGSDTYEVCFWKRHGFNCPMVKSLDDVYADNLQHVFTSITGLDCRL
jgi:hypothetical protein